MKNALFAAYKPAGMSSNAFLMRLKKKYGLGKCGYSGTLDPFASGLLIVATGAYTKLFDYLDKTSKMYEATLWLGAKSESLDIQQIQDVSYGEEIERREVEEVLQSLRGKLCYIPPKFSAKHVQGRRAYELARAGIDFELQAHETEVFDIELLNYNYPFLTFKIHVREGTYIRSLGEIIAKRLGVDGALSALKRLSEGSVHLRKEEMCMLDVFSHLRVERIELLEYERQMYLGQKIKLHSQKLKIHTPYLVVFEEFFSIIEVNEHQEVKYRLNRMPRC